MEVSRANDSGELLHTKRVEDMIRKNKRVSVSLIILCVHTIVA